MTAPAWASLRNWPGQFPGCGGSDPEMGQAGLKLLVRFEVTAGQFQPRAPRDSAASLSRGRYECPLPSDIQPVRFHQKSRLIYLGHRALRRKDRSEVPRPPSRRPAAPSHQFARSDEVDMLRARASAAASRWERNPRRPGMAAVGALHVTSLRTTSPLTSVSRKSRPWKR